MQTFAMMPIFSKPAAVVNTVSRHMHADISI